ncbi:MAG: dihydropteroate synthase [Bacteroidales bacterium]
MDLKVRYINVNGTLLDLSVPKVMGIVNTTPDSFYPGSRYTDDESIIKAVLQMIIDGADIIDVGGYSSRPGAQNISIDEEKNRVLKAIRSINREFPDVIISVDTFRAEIAKEAVLECGAGIINDISGGESDAKMFDYVRELEVPYILMHMQGEPASMQKSPVYDDVVADILRWFGERIYRLHSMGVKDIILDPGFGFGKTAQDNFILLDRLSDFSIAGLPLLAGVSRKSMIWKTLETTPEGALNGTTVLNTIALMNGCDILRVHDVKEAVQAVKLVEQLKKSVN